MFAAWLRRWLGRGQVEEVERIKLGALPSVPAPAGFVCDSGVIVHAAVQAHAETAEAKALGHGVLLLTNRRIAFVGDKRPVQYRWQQIDSGGVRFVGCGC